MKWLLAGASGFLGQALRVRLASEGHEVTRLVRREPATATEFGWDPDAGEIDPAALDGVDAVVNLGGVGVFDSPWTEQRREGDPRPRGCNTTRTLAEAIAARPEGRAPGADPGQRDRAATGRSPTLSRCTEDDLAAADFLAQVTVQWEAATRPAAEAGVRMVFLRTSPVMDRSGGAFPLMKLAWSAGLGAVLGTAGSTCR